MRKNINYSVIFFAKILKKNCLNWNFQSFWPNKMFDLCSGCNFLLGTQSLWFSLPFQEFFVPVLFARTSGYDYWSKSIWQDWSAMMIGLVRSFGLSIGLIFDYWSHLSVVYITDPVLFSIWRLICGTNFRWRGQKVTTITTTITMK